MCIHPPPHGPSGPYEADSELFDLGFLPDEEENPHRGPERPGTRIGRYRLVRELGEGGFGTVWMAEQLEPVRRELALKLIKRGMASRELISRFEGESQALAMMDHPNIAAVFDAGTTRDGRPYFALEMVKGEPLTAYCDSRGLSIRDRVELFIPVCHAVQHAHQKAILHRDLKPSNILVAFIDGKAVPKVIDFGVAKALDTAGQQFLVETPEWTRAGMLLGTPEYMSPEQAGTMPDVDTRSDIYSLGVILHELLTGVTPLARISGKERPVDEMLRDIRVQETAKPSTAFHPVTNTSRGAALRRGGEPARLRRMIRGDLDWIVLKALEKDRRRRYPTATALAAELTAFLEERPISAAAPTWRYQVVKMVRRNKALAGGMAIAFIALAAATVISLWHAAQAEKDRALAIASMEEAEKSRALAEANAREAKEAVEVYLNRVTDHPGLREEAFLSLRRDLLETALPFYEKTVAKTGDDKQVLYDQSWALGRIGAIYRSLGNPGKAMDALWKAAAIDERLSIEDPANPDHAKNLCVTWTNLALMLREQGKPDEALALQRRALDRIDSMVKAFPGRGDLLHDQATHLFQLGQALADQGKMDEAETFMLKSIASRQSLAAKSPDQQQSLFDFSSSLADFGRTLAAKGRFEEAESRYRKALEIQEQLAGSESAPFQFRAALAGTYHNFGFYLRSHGKVEEALSMQERGVAIGKQLFARFPSTTWFQYLLASLQYGAGESLMELSREAEAEPLFLDSAENYRLLSVQIPDNPDYPYRAGMSMDRVGRIRQQAGDFFRARECFSENIASQRKALAIKPDSGEYRASLDHALDQAGNAFLEAGDALEAIDVAGEIPSISPDGWREHERASRMMAGAYDLLLKNGTMEPRERAGLMDRAAVSAIGMLGRSIELGNPALTELFSDRAFAALRKDPRFQSMELSQSPDPAGRSPSRFTLEYSFQDPGTRVWKRDGDEWSETPPSGQVKRFKIVRRVKLMGVSGTELAEATSAAIFIFIPDLGGQAPPQLMFKSAGGNWGSLGIMEGME